MKTIILVFLTAFAAAARSGLTSLDLIGRFALSARSGSLISTWTLYADGTADSLQLDTDGIRIDCWGAYSFDETTKGLIAIYNCPDGRTLTEEASLSGLTAKDLVRGATLKIHVSSNLDANSTLVVSMLKE